MPETMTAKEFRAQQEENATEDDIHMAVITWAQAKEAEMPALRMLFHPPNGGARDARTGARMKRLGVRKGVPDLMLLVPRGDFSGLALELKRPTGRVTPHQAWWLLRLRDMGYATDVAWTFYEATRILTDYCTEEYVPDKLHLPEPERP